MKFRTMLTGVQPAAAALGSCGLIAACLALGPSAATAAEPGISSPQKAALRSQMSAVGISVTSQDHLIAKLEAGVLPDSALEYEAPVSTVRESADGRESQVEVFADGSRRVTTATNADHSDSFGSFSSKSGCKNSAGWYTNCKISISDFFSSASFVVDYQTSSSSKAKVRDVRSARCANTIGGCSVSARVKRATQSSAGPAWAELSFRADVGHIGSGVSGAFGLRVSGKSVGLYE